MTDPSPEMRDREMWRARSRLARPTASPEAIERAIDSVLRDPHGKYAREFTRQRSCRTWNRRDSITAAATITRSRTDIAFSDDRLLRFKLSR